MLEAHYTGADSITCVGARAGLKTSLRLLKSQEPGIVLISQELIGALLACSFFCLFPNTSRGANHLQLINFDHLFAYVYFDTHFTSCWMLMLSIISFTHLIRIPSFLRSLYDNYNEKQENKIKCIIHYFERIHSSMPRGNVSFERKLLANNHNLNSIPYPKVESWSKSVVSLCLFEVNSNKMISNESISITRT